MNHFNGKYWIGPDGTIHSVEQNEAHEEFAEKEFHLSLEQAFASNYIRVQAFSGDYLFIDHRQETVLPRQLEALKLFFDSNYQTIAVEYQGSFRKFSVNENLDAFRYLTEGG